MSTNVTPHQGTMPPSSLSMSSSGLRAPPLLAHTRNKVSVDAAERNQIDTKNYNSEPKWMSPIQITPQNNFARGMPLPRRDDSPLRSRGETLSPRLSSRQEQTPNSDTSNSTNSTNPNTDSTTINNNQSQNVVTSMTQTNSEDLSNSVLQKNPKDPNSFAAKRKSIELALHQINLNKRRSGEYKSSLIVSPKTIPSPNNNTSNNESVPLKSSTDSPNSTNNANNAATVSNRTASSNNAKTMSSLPPMDIPSFHLQTVSQKVATATQQPVSGKSSKHSKKDSKGAPVFRMDHPERVGYLRKEGKVRKSIKRRWFALQGSRVAYYHHRDQQTPIGTFSLVGASISVFDETKNEFHVVTEGRTWVLFADTKQDMLQWIEAFNRNVNRTEPLNSPSNSQDVSFGLPLEVAVERALKRGAKLPVPTIVVKCIEFFRANDCTSLEGIFRISGQTGLINHLKTLIDNSEESKIAIPVDEDPHVVSGLLKLYFRELPTPLMTYDLYENWIAAQYIQETPKRIAQHKRLIVLLPDYNRQTLAYLLSYLKEVHDKATINKMDASNLSVVFGPTLVRPRGNDPTLLFKHMKAQYATIRDLIENYDAIFKDPLVQSRLVIDK